MTERAHSFLPSEAQQYGIDKAVILYHLRFWLDKNQANHKHIYDGYVWTYNTAAAFAELFPYFNDQKIARLLRELVADGILLAGNYNKVGYDRTKWYTLREYAIIQNSTMDCSNLNNATFKNEQSIIQNSTIECSDLNNRLFKNEQPIPDINTDIKTDINTKEKKHASERDLVVVDQSVEKPTEKPSGKSKSKSRLSQSDKDALLDQIKHVPLHPALDYSVWVEWVEYRSTAKGAKSLFQLGEPVRSMEKIALQLARAADNSWNPNDLINDAIANGWQGCVFDKHKLPNPKAANHQTQANRQALRERVGDIHDTSW